MIIDTIVIEGEINLIISQQKAFYYLADYSQDKNWRNEINETRVLEQQNGTGTLIEEDTRLSSKVKSHKLVFKCTEYKEPEKVIYETLDSSDYWTKNTRELVQTGSDTFRLNYKVEFDAAIIKYGLWVSLPKSLIHLFLKHTIKKYLKQFKKYTEQSISIK